MNREKMIERLSDGSAEWDMVVIGGGCVGLGVAVDAASRGYSVALIERDDFGQATSSRSTKLIHGGVRYLRQGRVGMVRESLRERGILRRNAAHLVRVLPILLPCYGRMERLGCGAGLAVYDWLARRSGFERSRMVGAEEAAQVVVTVKRCGLRGGVVYHDACFDDARLLIDLGLTAAAHGAAIANQVEAIGFLKESSGKIVGVAAEDREGRARFELRARAVVNAAGPFGDEVRRLDRADGAVTLLLSRGTHVVLDRSFLPGETAILVPRTEDGRVMFAIPFQGRVLLGTTDTAVERAEVEPRASGREVEQILAAAGRYFETAPKTEDIRAMFSGLRPLVKPGGSGTGAGTARISREHEIEVGESGLVSVRGGKWTTYRLMAEQCVNRAAAAAGLDARKCVTADLRLNLPDPTAAADDRLGCYGMAAEQVASIEKLEPGLAEPLHGAFPHTGAQVVWAARHEMARKVEDVLARRMRMLLLDARAAVEAAPEAARLMARELGRDKTWVANEVKAFTKLARGYELEGVG